MTNHPLKYQLLFHLLFFFLLLFSREAVAQDNVSFKAYSDAREVIMDSYFEVTFTLRNAEGKNFTPPIFRDFVVLAGPNTSTSMQIVNGQVSREVGYSYTLRGKKTGTFTIGSATVEAGGRKLRTDPLTVKIIPGRSTDKSIPSEKEAFVRLEPSQTEAFLGEQILLDYKLYTTVSLDGYDIMEEPDYRGFFTQELRRYNFRTQREVINGRQVTTKILRRLALFPQQTGVLTISPARIQLAVVEDNDRTGFFFSRNIRPLFILTDSVEIDVQALPGKEPEKFTGAVGRFDFQASVNRNQVTTDDAVSVMMLIQGNGDLKRIQAPPLMLSDSFEVYPPKVVDESISEESGELYGKKIFEYLILARYPGSYSIRPSFVFFNTDTGMYDTLSTGPYSLLVRQGTERKSDQNAVTESSEHRDIRFIRTDADFERGNNVFTGSVLFWVLLLIPLIVFPVLWLVKRRKEKRSITDSGALKRMHARREAEKRLSLAGEYLSASSSRAFYDEISKASFGYVSDKLNIPPAELSKHNIEEKLTSLQVPESLIEDLMDILHTSEKALFAGLDNAADMQRIYDKTVLVIAGMEEELE